MNKLIIIGNLTRDPDKRTTPAGVSVCSFTVAVNRRNNDDADFFRVNAWRELADNCGKYLAKGRKVYVEGRVRLNTYKTADGTDRAELCVDASGVEFLSPRVESPAPAETKVDEQTGMAVSNPEDLPF